VLAEKSANASSAANTLSFFKNTQIIKSDSLETAKRIYHMIPPLAFIPLKPSTFVPHFGHNPNLICERTSLSPHF
jgi:hypothetical protein